MCKLSTKSLSPQVWQIPQEQWKCLAGLICTKKQCLGDLKLIIILNVATSSIWCGSPGVLFIFNNEQTSKGKDSQGDVPAVS